MPGLQPVKILIADDDRFFINVFSDLVKGLGYECIVAFNGVQAVEWTKQYRPDVVIMDVVMPAMDGFEATRLLKGNPLTSRIPVIMVTSLTDNESKIKGLKSGANEFISKPVDEPELKLRIENLLKVKRFEDLLVEKGEMLTVEVKDKSEQLNIAFEQIKTAYIETIYKLTLAAEYRDKNTGEHIKRISLYSRLVALRLGLPKDQIDEIFFASPMHDIGKIGIPDSILLKPGKLTTAEFEVMKTHTTIGAKILSGSDSKILKVAEEVAMTHHERWDGLGYPGGLKGEEIPISGRITHIADAYDAMRSQRPYRKDAYAHVEAVEEINRMKGSFDPLILQLFNECAEEFEMLFEKTKPRPEEKISIPFPA